MSSYKSGEPCVYQEWDKQARKHLPYKSAKVVFWCVEYDEFEVGIGHYPVLVLEDDETHDVKSIPVRCVSFDLAKVGTT